MARIERFEDNEAWKKGRDRRKVIYKCSRTGEFARDFAPRDQIRRAAQSGTSNIAEGFGRGGNREFIQFLSDAKGSCGAVRDQLSTALNENDITQQQFNELRFDARNQPIDLRLQEISATIRVARPEIQNCIRGKATLNLEP